MRKLPTLTRHLLAWAFGALLLVWGTFMYVGYKTGEHEADELTDGHLAGALALLVAVGGAPSPGVAPVAAVPVGRSELKAHDYQQSMSFVVWDAQGTILARTGHAPAAPFVAEEGFLTLQLGEPPMPWRAFTRWDPDRRHKRMVLLSMLERDDLAEDIAEQVSEPGLWLLPLVALLLGLAIHRGLRPLHDVTRSVHELDVHSARHLQIQPRHRELAGAVDAINRLVDRYQAVVSRERALASEFAHELRTPLTALALHANGLRASATPAQRETLAAIEREALRAGDVLAQLLSLARASRAELDEAAQCVDLAQLAAETIAEFAPRAHASGRELALSTDGGLPLVGHPVLLQLALRNLIENALHHSPPGSQVEVQMNRGERWVQVCDEAPVAPAAAPVPSASTVLGWGLGHRVVEKVAEVHGARFERIAAGPGNCYRITFPATSD